MKITRIIPVVFITLNLVMLFSYGMGWFEPANEDAILIFGVITSVLSIYAIAFEEN